MIVQVRNENGFSLLGSMIGMAVFVIGILAILSMQTRASISTGNSLRASQVNSWAQDYLEVLVDAPFDDPELDSAADPLEPVESAAGNGIHSAIEGPYQISWVVFTSNQNGKSLSSLGIANEKMFEGVDVTAHLQDILPNTKLILVHVSHPKGNEAHLLFLKPDTKTR